MERLHSECLGCFAEKQLKRIPADADESLRIEYMQRALEVLASSPKTSNAPIIAHDIDVARYELFGIRDTFDEERAHFNKLMLGLEGEMDRRVQEAADPLLMAMQLAMMGNFIDFTILDEIDDERLLGYIEKADEVPVSDADLAAIKADLASAKTLAFLTDNCGEVVCDKVLMREIGRQYPDLDITVVVKGVPVVNDACREDAEQVGLAEVARVIDHGCDYPGNPLEVISAEARAAIEESDVVISKGQANFESLFGCGLNVWYLFMCKCQIFSERFSTPLFQGIIANDRRLPFEI